MTIIRHAEQDREKQPSKNGFSEKQRAVKGVFRG
jgi:hypothetical protein